MTSWVPWLSAVHCNAVARFGNALLFGDLLGGREHGEPDILVADVIERCYVLLGDNNYVNRGKGSYVVECKDKVILVYFG